MIPSFNPNDRDGNLFDINNYPGQNKLLIFSYPKNPSYNCTRKAWYFRDLSDVSEEEGAIVTGIISQSVVSHKEFAEKTDLHAPI